MNSLTSAAMTVVLDRLFQQAEDTDGPMIAEMMATIEDGADPMLAVLDAEARDYKGMYHQAVDNFLSVSRQFGRLLYMCARAGGATRVVEFGTSFGISTIHLACAVRDNGGGVVVGTELEPTKAARAEGNLAAAGVADLVEVRVGDALETLRDGVGGEIDLVHLDGAFSLYRPVLKLLQPHLRRGAMVLAENGTPDYFDYVRDPANGYLSLPMPFEPGRGNEMSVFTG